MTTDANLRNAVVEAMAQAVRQFAFDIVMNLLGLDESDTDDQVLASEIVDGWMEHWHRTGAEPALDAALDVLGEQELTGEGLVLLRNLTAGVARDD